jgi:hypothetical protein
MKRTMKTIRLAMLALLAAVLLSPQDAVTCGPFFPEYEFAPLHGPIDRAEYVSGHLGVLRPHFYREPLLIAYRHLAGVRWTADEIAGLSPPAEVPAVVPTKPTAVERWLAARARVPGAAKLDYITQERDLAGPDQFQMFPNCLDDAFTSATATLAERERRWGRSAQVTEWLRGQDRVFENCSGKTPVIPAALPAGADKLLAADRQYQSAAAEFYALQFPEAERDFAAVAANGDSPWRGSGAYLATRALIREGTLLKRPEKLREAQSKLATLRSDPHWRDSARGLEDFVAAALDPKAALIQLGAEWAKPGIPNRIDRVLTDYTHIADREGVELPTAESEVADWIVSFQTGKSLDHIIDRWRKGGGDQWLVAALAWADPNNAAVPDAVAAARRLAPTSPAWATATYYGIRLQIQRGETDAARDWADAALATKQTVGVENLLRAERLRLVRDWDEFLRYAVRKPAGMTSFESGDDPPDPSAGPALDLDFTTPMNRAVPLSDWTRAAQAAALPRSRQEDIAQAGWVRAVLLGDAATARTLGARLRDLRQPAAAAMTDYLAHPDSFTAAFWMLRLPGLSPILRSGVGRQSELNKIDSFRDNWWRIDTIPGQLETDRNHEPLHDLYPPGEIGPREFLPATDRSAGEAQYKRLTASAATGVNYLCGIAIEFAKSHPQDPRVPEALHLAVRATRYGITDDASHAFSKQAFEILHRRYPNSEWAKNTKYYY